MKISFKDVVTGNICVCTQQTETLDEDDMIVTDFNSRICEQNIIFIKDKFGSYVRFDDVAQMGSLALSLYGAAQRLKPAPQKIKDKFVANLTPLFPDATNEMVSVKEVIKSVHSLNSNLGI